MKLEEYELHDLKLVYRVLHSQLTTSTELIDSGLLQDLQSLLQKAATQAGIDVADHSAWDSWLGNPVTPCDERMQARRPLS